MHDPKALRIGHHAMGVTLFYMVEPRLAAEHFSSARSLDVPAYLPLAQVGIDLRVAQLYYLARALSYVEYQEQALQRELEAVARARTLSHPHSTEYANAIATLRLLRGGLDEADEIGDQLFAMFSDYGLADGLAGQSAFEGRYRSREATKRGYR